MIFFFKKIVSNSDPYLKPVGESYPGPGPVGLGPWAWPTTSNRLSGRALAPTLRSTPRAHGTHPIESDEARAFGKGKTGGGLFSAAEGWDLNGDGISGGRIERGSPVLEGRGHDVHNLLQHLRVPGAELPQGALQVGGC